jgi:tRNA U34 5-methylaminomethyl-2-thiouridine-forming methyltransferase MnmC
MSTTPTNIPSSIEIITTSDGSNTLINKNLEEPYHSKFGAIQESRHLFINHGWEHLEDRSGPVAIFEAGFGTGLNALLSALQSEQQQQKVLYASLELEPLPAGIWEQLNYPDLLSSETTPSNNIRTIFHRIHQSEWESVQEISPWFHLLKLKGDLRHFAPPDMRFDTIYFDAFGPDVQPMLWSREVFQKMLLMLKPQGRLITYSCKGTVKRNLRAVGFALEKIPGPPGKRECLRAWKS